MNYILGHKGFIGSHLVSRFVEKGVSFQIIDLEHSPHLNISGGTLYYCIGVTNLFREKIEKCFVAHVGALLDLIRNNKFERVVYLSSARVYVNQALGQENEPIEVQPSLLDHAYNISKLAGESLLLHSQTPNVLCLRLSNVLGKALEDNNLLKSIYDTLQSETPVFNVTEDSSRDFIDIENVLDALETASLIKGKHILNLCSGYSTTFRQIVRSLGADNKKIVWGETRSIQKIDVAHSINLLKLDIRNPEKIISDYVVY